MRVRSSAPGLVEQVCAFPTAVVSDVQGRQYMMRSSVKPVVRETPRVLRTALTTRVTPGRHALSMKATGLAERADAPAVIERATERVERERGWIEWTKTGELSILVDSDEELRERGCLVLRHGDRNENGTGGSR